MLIGIISDTHDLLRPTAVEALAGVDEIIHVGDFCGPEILERLRKIAPVRAVRGNCDHGEWAEALPMSDTFELDGALLHAVHNLQQLDLDPAAAKISLVLYGHTHQLNREERNGVVYFNPGSAGPRRFDYPVTIAHLRIDGGAIELEPISLE